MERALKISFANVRPLVRYVDEDQAVLETHLALHVESTQPGPGRLHASRHADLDESVEVAIELRGPGGMEYYHQAAVPLKRHSGMTRFEIATPSRWWPAGMGEQALYDFCVTLMIDGEPADTFETTLGMTSVRPARRSRDLPALDINEGQLLVNGRACDIDAIVPVLPADEGHILPAGGHSILLVRDHFGPDLLYDAADRAGILLVQSLPRGQAMAQHLASQVNRLTAHPSLAGWVIERADSVAREIADGLRQLDPTRSVFLHEPR